MPVINVNDKEIIKIQRYYHCFKFDEKYFLFDEKMDMPVVVGSYAIIKVENLPKNSIVFLYKQHQKGFFEKGPKKIIEIRGNGKHVKPPLRYHYILPTAIFYHHFKLNNVMSVLFDDNFNLPITYGSNQKIDLTIRNINQESEIFHYKEDASIKHSFKLYIIDKGKKLK